MYCALSEIPWAPYVFWDRLGRIKLHFFTMKTRKYDHLACLMSQHSKRKELSVKALIPQDEHRTIKLSATTLFWNGCVRTFIISYSITAHLLYDLALAWNICEDNLQCSQFGGRKSWGGVANFEDFKVA